MVKCLTYIIGKVDYLKSTLKIGNEIERQAQHDTARCKDRVHKQAILSQRFHEWMSLVVHSERWHLESHADQVNSAVDDVWLKFDFLVFGRHINVEFYCRISGNVQEWIFCIYWTIISLTLVQLEVLLVALNKLAI